VRQWKLPAVPTPLPDPPALQPPVLVQEMRGHVGAVQALAVTNDGSRVLSGGSDLTIRAWELSKASDGPAVTLEWFNATSTVSALQAGAYPIKALRAVPAAAAADEAAGGGKGGEWVACGTADGQITIVDLVSKAAISSWRSTGIPPNPIFPMFPSGDPINYLSHMILTSISVTQGWSASPGGVAVISAGNDGVIRIWELIPGNARLVRSHAGDKAAIMSLAATPGTGPPHSPDSQRVILSASQNGSLRVWIF